MSVINWNTGYNNYWARYAAYSLTAEWTKDGYKVTVGDVNGTTLLNAMPATVEEAKAEAVALMQRKHKKVLKQMAALEAALAVEVEAA